MKYEKLITQLNYLATGGLSYWTNLENKIKINDFKVITTSVSDGWYIMILGPDNQPFAIQHPKLHFTSSTWHITKDSSIAPWFVNELPTNLFLFIIQFWMKLIAYRLWMQTADKPKYYTGIINAPQDHTTATI